MACSQCEERRKMLRDAIMRGKLMEAAKHATLGAAEMAGVKGKGDGMDGKKPG